MAELKRNSPIEVTADQEYVVMVSRFPLNTVWMLPQFLRYTLMFKRQLRSSRGLVWFFLLAQFLSRRFWALSVWQDEETVREFLRNPSHRPVSGQRSVRWKVPGSQVPPAWDEASKRLEAD